MRIGRRAGAEEAQRRLSPNDVRGAGRQQDRIARPDFAPVAVHLDLTAPIEDEIDLLSPLVMMALGGLSRRQPGLGQALVLHRRVGPVEDAANDRAVGRGERCLGFQIANFHLGENEERTVGKSEEIKKEEGGRMSGATGVSDIDEKLYRSEIPELTPRTPFEGRNERVTSVDLVGERE